MNDLLTRYPQLDVCADALTTATASIIDHFANGGKLLLCGNGGSCADCDHIVGELMKGFHKKRPLSAGKMQTMKRNCPDLNDDILYRLQEGLPAISLCSLTALNTAFCNDVNPDLIYAQSVLGLGKSGDVLLCISTSGNAKNVCAAALVAQSLGITVIGLTGISGGRLSAIADVCICVPETETFAVQELHLPVYHYLCSAIEDFFFKN